MNVFYLGTSSGERSWGWNDNPVTGWVFYLCHWSWLAALGSSSWEVTWEDPGQCHAVCQGLESVSVHRTAPGIHRGLSICGDLGGVSKS